MHGMMFPGKKLCILERKVSIIRWESKQKEIRDLSLFRFVFTNVAMVSLFPFRFISGFVPRCIAWWFLAGCLYYLMERCLFIWLEEERMDLVCMETKDRHFIIHVPFSIMQIWSYYSIYLQCLILMKADERKDKSTGKYLLFLLWNVPVKHKMAG